jgi:hypothetical protein
MTKQHPARPNGALHNQAKDVKNTNATLPLSLESSLKSLQISSRADTNTTNTADLNHIATIFVAYSTWLTNISKNIHIESEEERDAFDVMYDTLFAFAWENVGVWEEFEREFEEVDGEIIGDAAHLRCFRIFLERVGVAV